MIESTTRGVSVSVRVVPRAKAPGIAGIRSDALLVRLSAPPVEGAANEELIEVIARALSLPMRCVTIARGGKTRNKRVLVQGLSRDAVEAALKRFIT